MRLNKIITEIERKILEVATDKIDFSDDLDNRFCRVDTFIEIDDIYISFSFDAHDTENEKIVLEWIEFDTILNSKSKILSNVTEYLNNYHYTL
jgi:hypothetical protein